MLRYAARRFAGAAASASPMAATAVRTSSLVWAAGAGAGATTVAARVAPRAAVAAAMRGFGAVAGPADLNLGNHGLGDITGAKIFHNLTYDEIYEHELTNYEGIVTDKDGTVAINTTPHHGRSAQDRYVVDSAPSNKYVDWGKINRPMTEEVFDELHGWVKDHFNAGGTTGRIYVFDGFCGAHPDSRLPVRIVTEYAWQHHFVKNMFIEAKPEELVGFEPKFTVLNASTMTNPAYKRHGLRTNVFVTFNIDKGIALIGGTRYGGEMKKGIFAVMNYLLPLRGDLPMHCSANKGANGDTALFFGLSGTGKTTLSADPDRFLIGDDEHGWDDNGIFNFEGGCYAKTHALSPKSEPEIYAAIRRNALLENVVMHNLPQEAPRINFNDSSFTENGRVSYPLEHIEKRDPESIGTHPNAIIFLTCDAYGVLPPVSRLSPEQAMYHFLSGYTAKVAGTERGVTEPTPTFSACFGAVFMPHHPFTYAKLLAEKMRKHGAHAYLVNTGWAGGDYKTASRMSIGVTRTCITAILDGSIEKAEFETHPVLNLDFPKALTGLTDQTLLNPRNSWANTAAYDKSAAKLAKLFVDNFEENFTGGDAGEFAKHGPKVQ